MKIMKDRPKDLPKYVASFAKAGKKKHYYCYNDRDLSDAIEKQGGAGWTMKVYRCRYEGPHTHTWNKRGMTK